MKYLLKYYIFLFSLVISADLFGQNLSVDSLVNVLKTLKDDTNKLTVYSAIIENVDDTDPLHDYIVPAKQLATELMKSGNAKIRDKATYEYANCISTEGLDFFTAGESEKAINCFKEAYKLCEKTGRYIFLAGQLNSLASIYLKQGHLGLSLESYMKCMTLIEKTGDKNKTSIALSNIGSLYKGINENRKALEYLEKSLKLKLELKTEKGVATIYNNIGGLYFNIGDTALASDYYYKALALSKKLNEVKTIARSYTNVAKICLTKKNNQEAYEYLFKALDFYEKVHEKEGMAFCYGYLSSYYINMNQYANAETYASRSLQLSKELGYPDAIKFGAKNLTDIYKHNGNSAKALEMYELYIQNRDSTNNEITRKTLARQEIEHEYEIKEAASKLEQEKKDAIAIEEAKKQRIITLSVCAVLVLVFAFAIFAYRSFLRKRKDHIEITKQKDVIEDKQMEILASIRYAQRIQKALITSEKYIDKNLDKLIN